MTRPHPFDRATIEAILPHRHPFLFVDRILDYEPARWIIGVKLVSRNDRFLCPDGSNAPTLPASLVMETMAQIGALLVLGEPANRDKLAVITSVERARYRRPVRAGDELEVKVAIKRWVGPMGRLSGTARVNGQLVASGIMQVALVPRDRVQDGTNSGH